MFRFPIRFFLESVYPMRLIPISKEYGRGAKFPLWPYVDLKNGAGPFHALIFLVVESVRDVEVDLVPDNLKRYQVGKNVRRITGTKVINIFVKPALPLELYLAPCSHRAALLHDAATRCNGEVAQC